MIVNLSSRVPLKGTAQSTANTCIRLRPVASQKTPLGRTIVVVVARVLVVVLEAGSPGGIASEEHWVVGLAVITVKKIKRDGYRRRWWNTGCSFGSGQPLPTCHHEGK